MVPVFLDMCLKGWGGGDLDGRCKRTYTLLLVALNNGEVARVGGGLHDEPAEGFFVLAVDAAGLDQLGLELVDGGRVVVGAEVDGDCVDHFRGAVAAWVGSAIVLLFTVSPEEEKGYGYRHCA